MWGKRSGCCCCRRRRPQCHWHAILSTWLTVEPSSTGVALQLALLMIGIGGDMFLLYYDAKTKKVSALNGSGRAPVSLSISTLRKKGIRGNTIPMTDVNAITVPGAAAGWLTTLEKFGSHQLSVAEILAPAIQLAEEGFPVSELSADAWQSWENIIK